MRRLNLGGKALTNVLKEKVSLRAWNMMDEFYVLDDIKERFSSLFYLSFFFQLDSTRLDLRYACRVAIG